VIGLIRLADMGSRTSKDVLILIVESGGVGEEGKYWLVVVMSRGEDPPDLRLRSTNDIHITTNSNRFDDRTVVTVSTVRTIKPALPLSSAD